MDTKRVIFACFLCSAAFAFCFDASAQRPRPPSRQSSIPKPVNVSLQGTLLDAKGKPLPYIELQLMPPNAREIINDSRLIAASNSRGKFVFADVPDGVYTLSIKFNDMPTDLSPYPTYFFPGSEDRSKAKQFTISAGTPFETVSFKLLEPLKKIKLTGQAVWSDTKQPVQGAFIGCRDIDFQLSVYFGTTITDRNGRFEVVIYSGRRYQAAAALIEPESVPNFGVLFGKLLGFGETEPFVPTVKMEPITIEVDGERRDRSNIDRYLGWLSPKWQDENGRLPNRF